MKKYIWHIIFSIGILGACVTLLLQPVPCHPIAVGFAGLAGVSFLIMVIKGLYYGVIDE